MIPFENIAIIGSGNVAYTYSKVLKDNGINLKYVFVRNQDKISEVEKKFGVKAVSDYETIFSCDLIIIAVKDDAIADVASHLKNYKGVLVHTSGTQNSTILQIVENYGIIYPLQTLTKDYEIDFKSVPLLINASSSEVKDKLRVVAKKMSDVVIECSDEDRRYIHMNAVYVSNFVNVMLQIGEKLLKEKSLDISILEPLVRETVNKAFSMGAEKALTGPARRGDKETINKHLNLLKDNNEEKEIYKLLTNYIINKYLEK
jgi:predicted short-subunit dehydrogenase-like oxidoreductase (DUF2520 family)